MHRRANGNDDLKDRILMALRTEARGRKHAILSSDLAEAVGESSRVVRAAISEMRKDGYLILSAVRPPYGYWLAASQKEWSKSRDHNLLSRAHDLLETDRAMSRAAQARWGKVAEARWKEPKQLIMAGFGKD